MSDEEQRESLEQELAQSRELVHELEQELAALKPMAVELRQELRSLRSGIGSTTQLDLEDEEWGGSNGSAHAPAAWTGAGTPPPLPRPVIVPRLVLETAFLILAAAIAVLADLDPVWIVVVMTGAWAIVALSEWAAFAKQRRWRLDEVAPVYGEGGSPAWYAPPVERTMLEPPAASESHTIVAGLPADETAVRPAVAVDETGEIPPEPQRRFGLRRRKAVEPADDPWES